MSYGYFTQRGIPVRGNWWGTQYFVDGTNGSDGNTGLRPDRAFATIQRAFTVQIADTTSLGDTIHVLPGTYAETVYASAMTLARLEGMSADSAIIAPTDDHGLLIGIDKAGGNAVSPTMNKSHIKNMTFLTPSTSNTTRAAMLVAVIQKSVIEDCYFKGTTTTGTGASATVGLQMGNRTDCEWEFHGDSRISRCKFFSNAGRATVCGVGIHVGSQTSASPTYTAWSHMMIEDCVIGAKDRGIRLNVGGSGCGASVIRRNVITSEETGGVGTGIEAVPQDDTLCSILENRIIYIQDAILGFSSGHVQGNIIGVWNGTPTDEAGYND